MPLFILMAGLLLAMADSAPVVNNATNLRREDIAVCSNTYEEVIEGLRQNWNSPIIYLKNRGYIPKDAEKHLSKDLAKEVAPQSCNAPRIASPSSILTKERNPRAHTYVKGLLDINNPIPMPKTDVRPLQRPVYFSYSFPKIPIVQQPAAPPDLAEEGKSFLKHLKDRIVELFRGGSKVSRKHAPQGGPLMQETTTKGVYTEEDFDREFANILFESCHRGHLDKGTHVEDKVVNKKSNKVPNSDYIKCLGTKSGHNDVEFLGTQNDKDKDVFKGFSERKLPMA